jgi:uncharacterized protein YdhG (YjbR/CyaY superfamily)
MGSNPKAAMTQPRFDSVDAFLHAQPKEHRETLQSLLDAIHNAHPDLELVLAWNVPHFKEGKHYVAGVSSLKNYVAFSPWSAQVMNAYRHEGGELESTKNLVRIPLGWEVDQALLGRMVQARRDEITQSPSS